MTPNNWGKIEFRGGEPFLPKAGGIYLPVEGWQYPVKGYPVEINVEVLAVIKGIIPIGLRFLEQSIKHFDLLAIWSIKNTIQDILIYGGKILSRRQAKNSQRYGRAVREFYRVMSFQTQKYYINRAKESIKEKENAKKWETYCFWYNLKVILCVLCEFDNAYRYRLQDFLIELNIENLIKNPIKEIRKVLQIVIDRENRDFIRNKWKRLKFILTLLMFFKPSIKRKIVEILSNINKEEIKFENDDWYCISMRDDYKFGGLTREEVISSNKF